MPYIAQYRRDEIDVALDPLLNVLANNELAEIGDIVYVIYRIVKEMYGNSVRFSNKVQGITALESAKLEYYRRVMVSHENEAIERNGDID